MEKNQILEKFSLHFKQALKRGVEIAQELGHDKVEPAHLFLALILERGSVGGEFLAGLKFNPEAVKTAVLSSYSANFSDIQNLPDFSNLSKNLIEQAAKTAFLNKHKYIGTEHLLSAICQSKDAPVKKIIGQIGLPQEELAKQANAILKTTSKLPEIVETFKENIKTMEAEDEQESAGPLDYFGRNLCDNKIQSGIDPVIGRDQEISRIIEILCRRSKNNPLLLGDPGVGKTAIIEGLAKKIILGEVPDVLADKKIYALDLAALVAGTSFRGEFEARLKEILYEIEDRPEVILFIDEIHQIVGAGSASGSMDAANILKPALARGEIRVIGATTFADFRKSIENDAALERRFQTVRIEEPNAEAAKNILSGVKSYFEKFHRVAISPEAVDSAVELSQRYLPEKFLPDKAIDLIDEAAAGIKANRRPSQTEEDIKAVAKSVSQLEANLERLISEDKFEEALALKGNLEAVSQQVNKLRDKLTKEKEKLIGRVDPTNIANIIAKSTGILASLVLMPDNQRALKIEPELKKEIIGQDEAIAAISRYLKRAKAGLAPENKPLAAFLFAGPSGVGKTFTAKILAKQFFGDDKALVKIDMSEYGEKFNASKLIGAPAGYVGYKESGQLTEKIKHRPFSLVLLDEIEKANPEIFDLLLSVLEDGYLTDASGTKISFTNTIIIMTSNLGSQYFNGRTDIGFGQEAGDKKTTEGTEGKILGEIKKWFKPEFINRLDQIICFNNLTRADLEKIADLELSKLGRRLKKEKGLTLEYDNQVVKIIADQTLSKNDLTDSRGARGIKSAIKNSIETLLADRILQTKAPADKILRLEVKNGIITLS